MNSKKTSSAAEEGKTIKKNGKATARKKKASARESGAVELTASERTPLKLYLQEIGKVALLTPREEIELALKIQKGDKAARERMIRANLRLVVKIAQDYNHFGLPFLDLISEGNIGLMKAIERFDPNRGGKLSTYAAWWIKQSIKRALANQSKTIRLPVHLVEKISKLRKTINLLEEEFKREPTNEEIGRELEISAGKVAHLKSVSVQPASLDNTIGADKTTKLGELIGDEKSPSPSDRYKRKAIIHDVRSVIRKLSARDAKIISMRFGLEDQVPKTLEEIGDALGITRERVRQLQNTILRQLRELVADSNRERTLDEIHELEIQEKRMEVIRDFIQEQQEKNTQSKVEPMKKTTKRATTARKSTTSRAKPKSRASSRTASSRTKSRR